MFKSDPSINIFTVSDMETDVITSIMNMKHFDMYKSMDLWYNSETYKDVVHKIEDDKMLYDTSFIISKVITELGNVQ